MANESEETSNLPPQANDMNTLSELLDEALVDFKKRPQPPPKCSDDDLDQFLAPMDEAATRKAAQNFERVLREVAIPRAMEDVETKNVNPTNPNHEFLTELLGIKQFMDDEGVEPEFRLILESLLKDCFTKDVILPLIKQFKEQIDEYLVEESVGMEDEEKNNLIEQQTAFAELISVYESSSEPPTAEQTEQQNVHWAKLRDLGDIPQPLIARFESKFQGGEMPNLPGFPSLGGGNAQCSIF